MTKKISRKVTAFVMREIVNGETCKKQLLLINHPNTDYQFPAGTLKKNEKPEKGALRETREETGLKAVQIFEELEVMHVEYPKHGRIIKKAKIFSRPNPYGAVNGVIRKGLKVRILATEGDFVQVRYRERDTTKKDRPIMLSLIGWIRKTQLSRVEQRHFFVVTTSDPNLPLSWENFADHHQFGLEWHDLENLPKLAGAQHQWFEQYKERLYKIQLN